MLWKVDGFDEEINNGTATYDLVVQRKQELFEAFNGLRDMDIGGCRDCANIHQKLFKDVTFDYIGGETLGGAFNIQHYTMCNERCSYCYYAQHNMFYPPKYDLLKVFELFNAKGKLRGNNIIDFSGGEPALLKDLDSILTYFDENNMGTVIIYTNATIFSQKIYDLLKENKVYITTSLDTGLSTNYKKLRGIDAYSDVISNLIRYRNSGTSNMTLKYIITEDNSTEDDLWSFLTAVLAIRPNMVAICPDFPYGDKQIPEQIVKFAAKLWYLIEKHLGNVCIDYTEVMGDPKMVQYRKDLHAEIKALKEKSPLSDVTILKPYSYCSCVKSVQKKPTFLQRIFSVRNENNHKVLRFFGLKLKFRRKVKNAK